MLCQDAVRVQVVEDHAVVRVRPMQEESHGLVVGGAAVGGSRYGQRPTCGFLCPKP
jgi:hypothetical protein